MNTNPFNPFDTMVLGFKTFLRRALMVMVCWLVGACGGVGEDGTGAIQPTLSVGVLKGLGDDTVTVNDVVYEKAAASVLDGFGNRVDATELRLGMWVEVEGDVNEVSNFGSARTIRMRPAARGVVSGVSADGLTVTLLQSTAQLDTASTVVDGVDSAVQLAVGDVVEVHGPLGNTAGVVEASRLEKLGSTLKPVELRGRISNLNAAARTMTVGKQQVSYASATIALRQALANGQVVRVASAIAPKAAQVWPVEQLVPDQPLPANLGFVYAEGLVDAWVAGPLFEIENLKVDASKANGRGAITANGQRVAVLGSLLDGLLVAKSVAVVKPGQATIFVLSGAVTDYKSITDFRVRGVRIDASAATFTGGVATALADGKKLKVSGTAQGRLIKATKVEFLP